MSETQKTHVPFSDSADLATEWNVDNVTDLTEAKIVVTNANRPYYKEMTFDIGNGQKETKQLAYIYCEIGKRTLPMRLNQISIKNLNKALKTTKMDKWNHKPVVLVHQTIGDKTFLVIKSKGALD